MDSVISIAVIGQNNSLEMNPILSFLNEPDHSFQIDLFPKFSQFFKSIHLQSSHYNIVLVLQNRPREYSSEVIHQLIHCDPLARILCCYSSWCESEGRNETELWPVSLRVPARAAGPRIQNLIDTILGRKQDLPLTASRDEVFLNTIPNFPPEESGASKWKISIKTADLEFQFMLRELIHSANSHLVYEEDQNRADICLWDADPLDEIQIGQLKKQRSLTPDSIIIPLMNFPQPDEKSLLQNEFNTTEVIPKLHLSHFLADVLRKSIMQLETVS